jgi:hypothetical protein
VTVIATARASLSASAALRTRPGVIGDPRFYAAVSALNWRATLGLDDEAQMVKLTQFPFRGGRISQLIAGLDRQSDEELAVLAKDMQWLARSLYNQRRLLGRSAMGWCEAILPGVGQLLRELDRRAQADAALLVDPIKGLFTAERSEILYRTAARSADASLALILATLNDVRASRRRLDQAVSDLKAANLGLAAWREATETGRRIVSLDSARYRNFLGPIHIGSQGYGGLSAVDASRLAKIRKALDGLRHRALLPSLLDDPLRGQTLRRDIEALNHEVLVALGECSAIDAMANGARPNPRALQAGELRPINDF